MEELRTTEALDREILEDARKKAHRILKTADDTLAAQKSDWEKKTRKAVDSIRKVYDERIKKTGEEILARLPLDKRRLRSETSEGLLVNALGDFLRSLPRERLLLILERELHERLEDCAGDNAQSALAGLDPKAGAAGRASGEGAKPELFYSGLSRDEASALLEKAFVSVREKKGGLSIGGIPGGKAGDWDFKTRERQEEFPAIVINTDAMKIGVSVKAAAAALMKDKRAELASALLGEGVLND